MCFVIAGVQPKTRTLDAAPKRCPRCGLHQAYTQQVDHYISLFFIPLLRVKQGEPYLYCRRCGQPVDKGYEQSHEQAMTPASVERPSRMCNRCGRSLEEHYKYCPHCGQRQ